MWESRQNSHGLIFKVDNGWTLDKKGSWLFLWDMGTSWVHKKLWSNLIISAFQNPNILYDPNWDVWKSYPASWTSCVLLRASSEWKRLYTLACIHEVLRSTYWVSAIRSTLNMPSGTKRQVQRLTLWHQVKVYCGDLFRMDKVLWGLISSGAKLVSLSWKPCSF